MKLLHTSDWHLGQSLNQFDRSFEHAQFLSWLLDTLESEQVDTLLIAGDVFDNTNPSAASQTQLYQFLTQARQRVPHLGIVMTAGNHDSPGRLEAPAPFVSLFDARVVGQIEVGERAAPFQVHSATGDSLSWLAWSMLQAAWPICHIPSWAAVSDCKPDIALSICGWRSGG